MRRFLENYVIWPLVWLGSLYYFRSGVQAHWIFEKVRNPYSFYLTVRNILNFRMGIPAITGWVSISVEPSAICNLACKYCARAEDHGWLTKRPSLMEWELYTRIIDGLPKSIKSVSFAGIGEPLLNPRIVDMIEYAAAKGLRVYMFTNGTLLKGKLLERIAASALDSLIVSMEPDSESARHYRNIDYHEIAEHIREFAAKKRRGQTVSISLVMNEMHADRIQGFIAEWKGLVDHVKISPQMGIACGDADTPPFACSELWRGNMDIKTDGSVSVCCFDSSEELVIGNVTTDSLKSMIHNEKYRELLRQMVAGNLPKRCRRCTVCTFSKDDVTRSSRRPIKKD